MMKILSEAELDLVKETKRNAEADFTERALDALAMAYAAADALTEKMFEKSHEAKNPMSAIVGTMLIVRVASDFMTAVSKHLSLPQAEVVPDRLRARYERLKAAGKVPA